MYIVDGNNNYFLKMRGGMDRHSYATSRVVIDYLMGKIPLL